MRPLDGGRREENFGGSGGEGGARKLQRATCSKHASSNNKNVEGRTDRPVRFDYPDLNPTIRAMGVVRDTFIPAPDAQSSSQVFLMQKKNKVGCGW